jgi:PPK2 family polyphosphate:nucleotide phosphotransferase
VNLDHFLIRPGHRCRLADLDPAYTSEFKDKDAAGKKLAEDIDKLAELQDVFAAAQTHALLVILQGMDTSGKDGAIKHVMSGINPQGVDVYSFKAPSVEELSHDYLWRYHKALPARGRIGILNRSYFEEVLVVRVHKEALANEHVPTGGAHLWQQRFDDLNTFERHLVHSGTLIVKFFLHISKEEQRKRLLERLDDPNKTWKFSRGDFRERQFWDDYTVAYEEMLNATSTDWAPWYAIPSDRKWFMRTAIADILVTKLAALGLRYPAPSAAERAALEEIQKQLR